MAYTNSDAIGEITEVTGEAIVIRTDGTEEVVTLGTEIFLGDIIETTGDGAVNIGFTDESSFAVSDNARVAIDEYVYDPVSESGDQDFSVMRGVFMYTSGLIGRENPDSVEIDTPVGSIGIRGTIIGGKIAAEGQGDSQISVIEGAIVVRNEAGEQLLTNMFDTVKLSSIDVAPSDVQQLDVSAVANDYGAVKGVSASLFSSFDDQMKDQGVSEGLDESSVEEAPAEDIEASSEEVSANNVAVEAPVVEGKADGLEKAMKAKEVAREAKMEKMAEKLADKEADRGDLLSDKIADQLVDRDAAIDDSSPTTPDTTPPIASGTLSLSVDGLLQFSKTDGIEGFLAVDNGSGTYKGVNIAQLSVDGSLAGSVNVSDFAIGGGYEQYLHVVKEDEDFFLALKNNVHILETGDSGDYKFAIDGVKQGEHLPLDADGNLNLADITVSKGGVSSSPLGIEVNVDEATNSLTGYTGETVIIGTDSDGSGNISDTFDFKLIDGGGGHDYINLTNATSKKFIFWHGSASNITDNSRDLKSIEHIFFDRNDDGDTLTIGLENIERLLKTSDNSQTTEFGTNRELNIHKNSNGGLKVVDSDENGIIDAGELAAAGGKVNGITFLDEDGMKVQLSDEAIGVKDSDTGFTYLGAKNGAYGAYDYYQHELGIVKIESQIDGASTGGL